MANVPLVVIGVPVTDSPVGTEMATDVTVPDVVLNVAMVLSDFFKNNTPSAMLQPSSPTRRSFDVGTLLVVLVDFGFIAFAIF